MMVKKIDLNKEYMEKINQIPQKKHQDGVSIQVAR